MSNHDPNLAPWPFFAKDEIQAVGAVLQSGHVNYRTGKQGTAFEAEYAAATDAQHALTVANGTAALELALSALDIGPDDEVVVPARTFIATAAAVVRCGATPVVADIDPISQNLDQETLSAVLTERTRAVIPVHLAGWPADMDAILSVAQASGLAVIEDCAQAHGALYKGKAVGTLGDIGCFSFCQDKIISTGGEGGMVLTNNPALYKRMWSLRDHGWDYERANEQDNSTGFKWLVDTFSTNWRLTESQSAIGRLQLRKLEDWVSARRHNAAALSSALKGLAGVADLTPPESVRHSYYKYNVLIDPKALSGNWTRDRIVDELNVHGIPARVGACPDISGEKAFAHASINTSNPRPNAAGIADRTLMLPVHPTLTDGNMAFIADTLRATISAAVR
ncbi:MAG: aminotransferase [Alphaproteobacteria bacterium]|nr:aminotransferase [Alphaproteobacteria bacterium]